MNWEEVNVLRGRSVVAWRTEEVCSGRRHESLLLIVHLVIILSYHSMMRTIEFLVFFCGKRVGRYSHSMHNLGSFEFFIRSWRRLNLFFLSHKSCVI
jgi:hypothetical protein